MTERGSLLMNVLRCPADLTARAVYADWLAEQDDPADRERGEFIAGSLELDRAPRAVRNLVGANAGFRSWWPNWQDSAPDISFADCVRFDETRQRVSRLHAQNVEEWTLCATMQTPVWVAGFLDRVTMTHAGFHEFGRRLFELHPITSVTLSDVRTIRPTADESWCVFAGRHGRGDEYKIGSELYACLDLPEVDQRLGVEAKDSPVRDISKKISEAAVRLGCKWAGVDRG